mgnify:CR=1 FL=1
MKTNISITIDSVLLEEVEEISPGKKRSQLIEEALILWHQHKRMNQVKSDALKLKKMLKGDSEELLVESETLGDGIFEV